MGRLRRCRSLRLDPNTVPPEVLAALPHVGSGLVDRWVKAREERPFRSLEDARARVRGLGPATLDQIAPYFDFPDGPAARTRSRQSRANCAGSTGRQSRESTFAGRSGIDEESATSARCASGLRRRAI